MFSSKDSLSKQKSILGFQNYHDSMSKVLPFALCSIPGCEEVSLKRMGKEVFKDFSVLKKLKLSETDSDGGLQQVLSKCSFFEEFKPLCPFYVD
ncbi:hypothetical protein M5689_020405 [Euphorbia peplus]|nr:hypothetical protein M5689_020405 [Euphorbia peplus]